MTDETMASQHLDFSTKLHELRSAELRRLPAGASTVLHGGASGRWYFEWFDENYAGRVRRHVGVEAFAERPADLPGHVEWLRRTLGDMAPVPHCSVDMVFGGQVIEHLWADDVAGFLIESWRVLRADGLLVLDSPNRLITESIGWHQPEHTVEFSVDEITRMLALAGFEVQELRGVLLGYDRDRHVFLELEDQRMSWEKRAERAAGSPEESFVWWVLARRASAEPDRANLVEFARACADRFRTRRLCRLTSSLPVRRATGRLPVVCSPHDHAGPLLRSPGSPFPAGDWRASACLRLADGNGLDPTTPVAALEAVSCLSGTRHARREVLAGELDVAGDWTLVALDFSLPAMTMGIELGVDAYAPATFEAQLDIAVRREDDVAKEQPSPPAVATGAPEPRTVELIDVLRRRAAVKASAAVSRLRT